MEASEYTHPIYRIYPHQPVYKHMLGIFEIVRVNSSASAHGHTGR